MPYYITLLQADAHSTYHHILSDPLYTQEFASIKKNFTVERVFKNSNGSKS